MVLNHFMALSASMLVRSVMTPKMGPARTTSREQGELARSGFSLACLNAVAVKVAGAAPLPGPVPGGAGVF